MKKIKYICPHCFGQDITFEAPVKWDYDTQKFYALNPYDESHTCNDCDIEVDLNTLYTELNLAPHDDEKNSDSN